MFDLLHLIVIFGKSKLSKSGIVLSSYCCVLAGGQSNNLPTLGQALSPITPEPPEPSKLQPLQMCNCPFLNPIISLLGIKSETIVIKVFAPDITL